MVLIMILVNRAFTARLAARNHQQQVELEKLERLSITEPVAPTFDWNHSIGIAGTPEAMKLPTFSHSTETSIQIDNIIDED